MFAPKELQKISELLDKKLSKLADDIELNNELPPSLQLHNRLLRNKLDDQEKTLHQILKYFQPDKNRNQLTIFERIERIEKHLNLP